jgi:putative transposase
MSHFRRGRTGTTFFFTLVAYRHRTILCDDMIRAALREAIRAVRTMHPFTIDAWVLLPDHMHCIWTLPPGDTDFSQRWSQIKRRVSVACGRRYRVRGSDAADARGESTIWQRPFWKHRIRNEVDMQTHMDYIHFNPVRHGYVNSVAAWPYSTFGRLVRAGIYAEDWGGTAALQRLDLE